MATHLARRALLLTAVAVLALAAWFALGRSRPRAPDLEARNEAPAVRASSLLLVTIDTLRADAVGAYGSTTARTPAIDRLAREGVLFERAFAVAPITLTSHASLLTGLLPPGHHARHNGMRMADAPRTLAESARASGARTAAFVSAFPLDRSFGLDRGFQLYSDRMPRGADGRLADERPGRQTVDEAIAWLRDSAGDRFFVWIHLFEPHAPYGNASDGRPVAERYAEEVSEADRQLGRVVDALGALRPDTAIVVAADHGEAFGEHGEIAHSVFVYDTTLRVPLIIAAPGTEARRVSSPVSLVDVAPTLVSLLGYQPWDTDGIDLHPGQPRSSTASSERGLYAETFAPLVDFGWSSVRSLRSGPWKYIAAPKPELYDLDADPAEQRNLADDRSQVAADLAARLNRISGPELPVEPPAADPEARRRLQALGYASGSRREPAGVRRDPKDARELAAAIALVLSGEVRGAELERALASILAEDPGNPQANLRMGYLRLEAGRCGEAERLFRRAIDGGLAGADAHLGLATCQGRRNATADALRSLEEARSREPKNPVVLANIGIARAALQQDQAAIDALRTALAIDPDLHEARFNLALALARSGDRAGAAREAELLLERLPPNAPQRSEVERLRRALR